MKIKDLIPGAEYAIDRGPHPRRAIVLDVTGWRPAKWRFPGDRTAGYRDPSARGVAVAVARCSYDKNRTEHITWEPEVVQPGQIMRPWHEQAAADEAAKIAADRDKHQAAHDYVDMLAAEACIDTAMAAINTCLPHPFTVTVDRYGHGIMVRVPWGQSELTPAEALAASLVHLATVGLPAFPPVQDAIAEVSRMAARAHGHLDRVTPHQAHRIASAIRYQSTTGATAATRLAAMADVVLDVHQGAVLDVAIPIPVPADQPYRWLHIDADGTTVLDTAYPTTTEQEPRP